MSVAIAGPVPAAPSHGGRILIVEDNKLNLDLATRLLERVGHLVLQASNAEDGVALARTERPDLILMDLGLPRMDGYAALAELRADPLTRHIPTLALTAQVMKGTEGGALKAGFDGFIAKPIEVKKFAGVVAGFMTPPRAADAHEEGGRILVVDDQALNRQLLASILQASGHTVIEASNGVEALARVADAEPDVMLLDVSMPGIDGFEVCRRLKSDPLTAALPVLMVTAMDQREQRLRGVTVGADDYLTKPIDRDNLRLRVRNALRMRRLHAAVERQFHDLQELERLRDSLVHMLIHDLRSPLCALGTWLELAHADAAGTAARESIEVAQGVAGELTVMVTDVIDVSRLESRQMPLVRSRVDLVQLAASAMSSVGAGLQGHACTLDTPTGAVSVICDAAVIRRVIANLVGNALKFTPESGTVRISVSAAGGRVRVAVADTGPGIAPEHHARIFEKFGRVAGADGGAHRSSGLGLTFCKLAVEAHDGVIGLESNPGGGTVFRFDLPEG